MATRVSGRNGTSSAFCEYTVGLELCHEETRSAVDHGGSESLLMPDYKEPLQGIFETHQKDGMVIIEHDTRVIHGKLSSPE
jgi:hypothetical protein